MAIKWAGGSLRLALKSCPLCWASMPSSADLQRQPQVPKTGICIFLVYRTGNNAHAGNEIKHETGTCTDLAIYKDDSLFFGRWDFEKHQNLFTLFSNLKKKFFYTFCSCLNFKTNIKNFQKQTKKYEKDRIMWAFQGEKLFLWKLSVKRV